MQSIASPLLQTNVSVNVTLQGDALQLVDFVLVAIANTTLEAEQNAPDLSTLPSVEPSDLQDSKQQLLLWAEANGYLLLLADTSPSLQRPPEVELQLSVPALLSAGYHRLLVLSESSAGQMVLQNLTDLLFYVQSPCDGFIDSSGFCVTPCPAGCFCTGDGRCWPQPGWWSASEVVLPASCLLAAACPGALEAAPSADSPSPVLNADGSRNTQRCAVDYGGSVCGDCGDGFYHDGTACRSCATTDASQDATFMALAFAAAAIISTITFLILVASATALATLVGVILFLQQTVVVGRTASQLLPSSQAWLGDIFTDVAFINLDVNMFHPGCTVAALSFVEVFWVTAVIMLAVAVLFTAAAALRASLLVSHLSRKRSGTHWRCWRRLPKRGADRPELLMDRSFLLTVSDNEQERRTISRQVRQINEITSWPASLTPDLTVGFNLGLDSHLSWWRMFFARLKHAQLVLLAIVYLRLTTCTLQVLECVESSAGTGQASQLLLAADLRTVCYQGDHLPAAVVAWLILVLFSVGGPVALFFVLRRVHGLAYMHRYLEQLRVLTASMPEQQRESSSISGSREQQVSDASYNAAPVDSRKSSASSVPSTPTASASRRAMTRQEVAAQLYLDQAVEQGLVSAQDRQTVNTVYLAACVEMLIQERYAYYGYLLYNVKASWWFLPVLVLYAQFAFACLTVLPADVVTGLFVAGLVFVLRAMLVAVVWPYMRWVSNVLSVSAAVVLVVQTTIALGLVRALSVTSVAPSATAAPQDSVRLLLTSAGAVTFFQSNLAFVAALVALIGAVVVASTLGCVWRTARKKSADNGAKSAVDAGSTASSSSRGNSTPSSNASTSEAAVDLSHRSVDIEMAVDPYADWEEQPERVMPAPPIRVIVSEPPLVVRAGSGYGLTASGPTYSYGTSALETAVPASLTPTDESLQRRALAYKGRPVPDPYAPAARSRPPLPARAHTPTTHDPYEERADASAQAAAQAQAQPQTQEQSEPQPLVDPWADV